MSEQALNTERDIQELTELMGIASRHHYSCHITFQMSVCTSPDIVADKRVWHARLSIGNHDVNVSRSNPEGLIRELTKAVLLEAFYKDH